MIHGEKCFIHYRELPYLQFLKGFFIDQDGPDLQYDLAEVAIDKTNLAVLNGRVAFHESPAGKSINFRVLAVEMTYEHLCASFMEYVRMLDDLIVRYKAEYELLRLKREEQNQVTGVIADQTQNRTMLS